MLSENLRVLFVVNHKSGKKKGTDWEKEIRERIKSLGLTAEVFLLPGSGARKKLQDSIRHFRPTRVVVAGGDGTVSFVAAELLNTKLPLGILPGGSANGMAAELKIPADPEKAINLALNGEAKPTDVIRLNDQYLCLHLSDVGLNAQLVKYFEEGPWRGMAGYGLALVKALFKRRRIKVLVHTRDEEVSREAIIVIIANASKYGTGATINPEGNVHDGFFEVVIAKRIPIKEILKMFLKFQRFDPRHIEVLTARAVSIETSRKVHFQVDGEYLGKVTKVQAKVLTGALQVIVPL